MGNDQSAQVEEVRKATLEIKKETIDIEVDVETAKQRKTKITISGPEHKADGTQEGQYEQELIASEKHLKEFAKDYARQRLAIEQKK